MEKKFYFFLIFSPFLYDVYDCYNVPIIEKVSTTLCEKTKTPKHDGTYKCPISWLSLQSKYPQNLSGRQLRDENKALYMRLYRRDREWLKANSPKSLKRTSSVRIDWNKRDEEILAEVTKVVEELLNPENKPVRVTVSKVRYLIGERALLEKKLDKLPLTKSFLHQKVEL